MKSSNIISSYNAVSMFKSLVEKGDTDAAKTALELCQILKIPEIPCYIGEQVSEGHKLYDEVKNFAEKYNYPLLEKSFEDGILYKLQLPSK